MDEERNMNCLTAPLRTQDLRPCEARKRTPARTAQNDPTDRAALVTALLERLLRKWRLPETISLTVQRSKSRLHRGAAGLAKRWQDEAEHRTERIAYESPAI